MYSYMSNMEYMMWMPKNGEAALAADLATSEKQGFFPGLARRSGR
jgi:hypothetical protein